MSLEVVTDQIWVWTGVPAFFNYYSLYQTSFFIPLQTTKQKEEPTQSCHGNLAAAFQDWAPGDEPF